jgi:hypothetical protein
VDYFRSISQIHHQIIHLLIYEYRTSNHPHFNSRLPHITMSQAITFTEADQALMVAIISQLGVGKIDRKGFKPTWELPI